MLLLLLLLLLHALDERQIRRHGGVQRGLELWRRRGRRGGSRGPRERALTRG